MPTIVPAPIRLIGLGLQNERYQGPPVSNSTVSVGAGSNPQYLEDGNHLRWAFQNRLPWPQYGFALYARNSRSNNYVLVAYNATAGAWQISGSGGAGQNLSISSTSAGEFTLYSFSTYLAGAVIEYQNTYNQAATLPPGSIEAYPLYQGPGMTAAIAIGATSSNVGANTSSRADTVEVQPDQVDLGTVYMPLGNTLASQQGKSDPYYGAYLAGLFDEAEPNDDNFGAGTDPTATRVKQAEKTLAAQGGMSAGPTPWINQIHVSVATQGGILFKGGPDTTQLLISLILPVATTLLNAVSNPSAGTGTSTSLTVTPVSMTNIVVNQNLTIGDGTSNVETVTVTAVDSVAGTFTANFYNNHNAGEAVGDLPPSSPWTPETQGWTKILPSGSGGLRFPANVKDAVSRLLPSTYPSSWDTVIDAAGDTDASSIRKLYAAVFTSLAAPGALGNGTTIDPTKTQTAQQMNPPPGQNLGQFSLRAQDTLLMLAVDHYMARMWGLSYCDPQPGLQDGVYLTYDYLIAGFWTQDPNSGGVPDFYTTTFGIVQDQRPPLPAPTGLAATPILESFQPADQQTTFSGSAGKTPAIGLTWRLGQDPNAADYGLEVNAAVAFNVLRAPNTSGTFVQLNTHPIIIPRAKNPDGSDLALPSSFYIDSVDTSSPGGHAMLSGSYAYEAAGIDIFGRMSPASSAITATAPLLPPPPPPAFVTARYLDPKDPFLSSAEQTLVTAAGGATANIMWHWTAALQQSTNVDHFNLYYLDSLPAGRSVTLDSVAASTTVDGAFTAHATLTDGGVSLGTVLQYLVGGRLAQDPYESIVDQLGGPVIPSLGTHVKIAPGIMQQLQTWQWLITDAQSDGGTGANLTMQRIPDQSGVNIASDGDVPSSAAATIQYNLGIESLWHAMPSPANKLAAGLLPPPPATRLLLAGVTATTNVSTPPGPALVIEQPGQLTAPVNVVVGTDTATVTNVSGQTLVLNSTMANTWPKGTPVGVLATSAAISSGATSLSLNVASGIIPTDVIEVGFPASNPSVSTTTLGAIPSGTQSVTPASMPAGLAAGALIIVDSGGNGETVTVSSITTSGSGVPNGFKATFAKSHNSGASLLFAASQLTAGIGSGTQTATFTGGTLSDLAPGAALAIDSGSSGEIIIVTSVAVDSTTGAPTSFTANFTHAHGSGAPIAVLPGSERVTVTNVSGTTLTVSPPLQLPWPAKTPVTVADIPYNLAPSNSIFSTLGMQPVLPALLSGGYFGVSTVAVSPQDGTLVEGPVSTPAQIFTVSYAPPVVPASGQPPASQPPCEQLNRILTDPADANGISRATVPFPPGPSGPNVFGQVWRASDEEIFRATGQTLPLADTCPNNWALMELANNSIDRTGFTTANTSLSSGISAGATSLQLADTSNVKPYRKLAFLDSNGFHLETVTVAGSYTGGNPVPFLPAVQHAYAGGQSVQVLSQGMGPFTLITPEPIPWSSGTTFIDDTLHGLSDNVYFYTFTAVPVHLDGSGNVQASGNPSTAWAVTPPYQVNPTRPPVTPGSIRAIPGNPGAGSPIPLAPPHYNQIQLVWNYDLPPLSQLTTPPQRTYTVYRTTDPVAAADVRLMPVLHQLTFQPLVGTLAAAVSPGVRTIGITAITAGSMAGIMPGTALAVDSGGNVETVIVQSVSGSSITANFARGHSAGALVVGGSPSFLDGGTGAAADYSLLGNTDYYYRITAADVHGNVSPASNAVHARVIEQMPPPAPTNLRAKWVLDSGTGQWQVVLTWSNPRPDLQAQVQRMDKHGTLWRTVWPGPGAWSQPGASSAADTTADYVHVRHGYQYRLVIQTGSGYRAFSNTARL